LFIISFIRIDIVQHLVPNEIKFIFF